MERSKRVVLGVLLCFHTIALCLYEDQLGNYDWYKQYVGEVVDATFNNIGKPTLFVYTKSNVLAQLNLRNGEIEWRQVLEDREGVSHMSLISTEAELITLASSRKHLRSWRAKDGMLRWDKPLNCGALQKREQSLFLSCGKGSDELYIVDGKSGYKAYRAVRGNLAWEHKADPSKTCSLHKTSGKNEQLLLICANERGDGAAMQQLSCEDGEIAGHMWPQFPEPIQATKIKVIQQHMVALTTDGKQICAHEVSGAHPPSCSYLNTLGLTGAVKDLQLLGSTALLLTTKEGSAVIGISSNSIKVLRKLEGGSVASRVTAKAGAVVMNKGGQGVAVEVFSLKSGKTLDSFTAADAPLLLPDGSPVPVVHVFLGQYHTSSGDVGYRVLVVFADHTLSLLQQGQTVWKRAEALASVRSALFVDLPAPTAEVVAQYQATQPGLMDVINAQLLSLKVQFGLNTESEKQELRDLHHAMSDKLRPTRDGNGYRKLMVVYTASGSVFGLHNGDGHVMWQMAAEDTGGRGQLYNWRTPHDLQHSPELALLQHSSGGVMMTLLSAHSGQVISTQQLPYKTSKVLELHQRVREGSMDQHVLALVHGKAEEAKVALLPDTEAAQKVLATSPLYYWSANHKKGTITGFYVDPHTLLPLEVWSTAVAFPPKSSILSLATPDPDNAINSHTKVLGDRSLKVKYLNPNLLVAIVGPPNNVATEKVDTDYLMLTVWILDAVTGRALYSQSHRGGRGPVHAVVCENWVVYHYRSSINHRYEVSVLELYDDSSKHWTIWDVIQGEQNTTQSSYDAVNLEVLRQSFFVRLPAISTMSVSKTANGISQKVVLFGTVTGQVYNMDKRLLDPRRPRRPNNQPTNEDREEGLVPYSDNLPFATTLFVTLNRQVSGLSGITVQPAALESTCLVFVHGLDLFYSRIMPSQSFDQLQPDFPYALLVAVTTAMFGLAAFLRYATGKAGLKQKWT